MFSAPHPLASDCWQFQRYTPLLVIQAGVAGGGALFIHEVTVNHKNESANPQSGVHVIKTSMPGHSNPASAQPMRGLSARAQKLAAPRSFGISIGPRYQGEIPNAFRSTKG